MVLVMLEKWSVEKTTTPDAKFFRINMLMDKAHQLIPDEIAATIPALYSTEALPADQKIARVKLFAPWTNWTWYIVEYDPVARLAFGLVEGHEKEWGYFSLDELRAIRGPGGLRIERDLHFKPTPVIDL